jgi:putative salt-induced outer membrane protein YdiY
MCLISRDRIHVLLQNILYPVTTLTFLCAPLSVYAIVSMEDLHLGTPPQGFVGAFSLDMALDSGNTDQQGLATGAKFQWTEGEVTDFILINYEYGETSGIKNKNRGFTHFRHIEQMNVKRAWEGFAQGSFNEFTNLKLRALLGGGIRLTLGERNDKKAFLLGLGAFYEHEELDSVYPDEADTENKVRGSSYLIIKYLFNEHVTLVNSTYYQPSVSEPSDYRVIEDLKLVSSLSENTSLKVGINIAYDSEPPLDIKQTDTSLKVGIAVNF